MMTFLTILFSLLAVIAVGVFLTCGCLVTTVLIEKLLFKYIFESKNETAAVVVGSTLFLCSISLAVAFISSELL